jgi:hypothetical protein
MPTTHMQNMPTVPTKKAILWLLIIALCLLLAAMIASYLAGQFVVSQD